MAAPGHDTRASQSLIPRTAVRGFSDPFYSKSCQPFDNPTDGSPWIFQILSTTCAANQLGIPRTAVRGFFRSFLQHALPTSWESHGRQSVDFSDPFYNKRCQPVGNPTDGSPWFFQILSTACAANQLGIPRTAVRGFFRSFLQHALPTSWESHGRQSVVFFRSFLQHELPTSWESHGRQSVVFSDPFYPAAASLKSPQGSDGRFRSFLPGIFPSPSLCRPWHQ